MRKGKGLMVQNITWLYPESADPEQGYFLTYNVDEVNRRDIAVIICPGGGYSNVSMDHEGIAVAKWLNTLGVDAYVLRYRVTNDDFIYRYPAPLEDVQNTFRQIGKRHKKTGIMGFSAGGHLAGLALTEMGTEFAFGVLIYPVITSNPAYWHQGSFESLLGKDKLQTPLANAVSIENRINENTPPLFLLHCKDDDGVSCQNSLLAYEASIRFNTISALHLYEKGGHGFGMNALRTDASDWLLVLQQWLTKHFIS
jgi:acetyl esterase/lipase